MHYLVLQYIVWPFALLAYKIMSLVNKLIEKCKVCQKIIHPETDIGTTHQVECDWCGILQCSGNSTTGALNSLKLDNVSSFGYSEKIQEDFICDFCYDRALLAITNIRLEKLDLQEKRKCYQETKNRKKQFLKEEPTTIWLPLETYASTADNNTCKEKS